MAHNSVGPKGTTQRRLDSMREFLARVAEGEGVYEACRNVGIHRNTYYMWRKTYPAFAEQADAARRQAINACDVRNELDYDGSFRSFRKVFMNFDTFFIHDKIVEAIETCPPMGVVLILCPPESGKTTTLVDYLSKRIAEDPNIRVLYGSGRKQHVEKQLRRLKNRMTNMRRFPRYIARWGPFEPESGDTLRPWRNDVVTVAKADHDEADFTFEARSITSEVIGGRADVMILDDLQSRRTLNQTEAIVEQVRQDYVSRLGRTSILVIIGTIPGPNSVYEELIAAGIVNRVVRIPAVFDDQEPEPCPHEEGTCACAKGTCEGCIARDPRTGEMLPHYPSTQPELWDSHSLAVKRLQVGELAWARGYMQKAQVKGRSTFDEADLERAKDRLRPLGLSYSFVQRLGGETALHTIAGLDPALVGGCALTTCAATAKGLHVLDCHQEVNVGKPEAILTMVELAAQQYHLRRVVVEVNAYQKAFAEERHEGSLNALAARYGFVVVPHTTGLNKLDEDLGVAAMATNFRMGEIDLAWGDPLAVERIGELIAELLAWRPGVKGTRLRQDRVMALWFAFLEWMKVRRSLTASANAEWKRSGVPGGFVDYGQMHRPRPERRTGSGLILPGAA